MINKYCQIQESSTARGPTMTWLREPQPPAPKISHREHSLPEALEGN